MITNDNIFLAFILYIIEEISVNAQEEITTEYEDKFIKLGNPIYKIKCMK